MCNELIADLTGLDTEAKPEEGTCLRKVTESTCCALTIFKPGNILTLTGLRQLVLLNAVLFSQEGITESIAKQRLIFFIKHVVPWIQDIDTPLPIRAEVCRALTSLLPLIGDLYGEHWGDILHALANSWQNTTALEEFESPSERYVLSPFIGCFAMPRFSLIHSDIK